MKYTSPNLEHTQEIAKDFALKLSPTKESATVVGLYGELGSGKTSFTQGVAKTFGIKDIVTSPTFVIEKIYELQNKEFTHLIHIDAYRLEKSTELTHLGWKDIISDSKNLILIEWPERVADIMPKHIQIRLKTRDSGESRDIEIVL